MPPPPGGCTEVVGLPDVRVQGPGPHRQGLRGVSQVTGIPPPTWRASARAWPTSAAAVVSRAERSASWSMARAEAMTGAGSCAEGEGGGGGGRGRRGWRDSGVMQLLFGFCGRLDHRHFAPGEATAVSFTVPRRVAHIALHLPSIPCALPPPPLLSSSPLCTLLTVPRSAAARPCFATTNLTPGGCVAGSSEREASPAEREEARAAAAAVST